MLDAGSTSASICAVIVNVLDVDDPRSMFPLTVRFPDATALPVLDAIVNLSTPPDVLTAKLPSTSTVLLNSDVPVTTRFPPRVVAPLLTLSVPVD